MKIELVFLWNQINRNCFYETFRHKNRVVQAAKTAKTVNIICGVITGKVPITAATAAPTPILIDPLKAEAVPVLAVKGEMDAAVAFGLTKPIKNMIDTMQTTVVV